MRISVAMATYNGEKYLVEQLDSLRLQTRCIDELIICDDVSTDSTQEIVSEYINRYRLNSNWHFSVNEKNLGYADNFHLALTKTTGDIVFFCDQDDIWCPDKIKKMVDIMCTHPEINLLCSDFDPFTSSEDAPSISKNKLKYMKNDKSIEKIELNKKNIFIGSLGCLMCMRRKFIDDCEKYWFSGWAHDEYVWKLAQCMDSCYIYHNTLTKRRLHEYNVSMRPFHTIEKRTKYLKDLLDSHNATLKCATELNLNQSHVLLLLRNIKATELRIEMFEKKKLLNFFPLLKYSNCYHSKKSILVEPYLIVRNK